MNTIESFSASILRQLPDEGLTNEIAWYEFANRARANTDQLLGFIVPRMPSGVDIDIEYDADTTIFAITGRIPSLHAFKRLCISFYILKYCGDEAGDKIDHMAVDFKRFMDAD